MVTNLQFTRYRGSVERNDFSAKKSSNYLVVPNNARAKRGVSPINKGLLGVSFVRFFMPFCKLNLEQNKKEITAILNNKQDTLTAFPLKMK